MTKTARQVVDHSFWSRRQQRPQPARELRAQIVLRGNVLLEP
jgi:hypothetical protein